MWWRKTEKSIDENDHVHCYSDHNMHMLQQMFSTYGISEQLVSDNELQFISAKLFSKGSVII